MKDKRNILDYQDDDTGIALSSREPQGLQFGPGNEEAIRLTCEGIGQLLETWGLKRVLGATWAFLYLCPEPASAKDICKALKISPALVSITLQDLVRWGVVKKLGSLGSRRDFYAAESDIWKLVRKGLQDRERRQVQELSNNLRSALGALEHERNVRPDLTGKRTCQFQKVRVEELLHTSDSILRFVDSAIHGDPNEMKRPYALRKVS